MLNLSELSLLRHLLLPINPSRLVAGRARVATQENIVELAVELNTDNQRREGNEEKVKLEVLAALCETKLSLVNVLPRPLAGAADGGQSHKKI